MDVLFSDSPTRMSSSPLIAARKFLNWSLCESDSDPGSSPAVGATTQDSRTSAPGSADRSPADGRRHGAGPGCMNEREDIVVDDCGSSITMDLEPGVKPRGMRRWCREGHLRLRWRI